MGRWARSGGRDLGAILFATSAADALAVGRELYTARTELVVEPVDVYVALTVMEDKELIWQCRYIWGSYTGPLLRERALGIAAKLNATIDRKERELNPNPRAVAVRAIRLAMELAWYGAPAKRHWPNGGGRWYPSNTEDPRVARSVRERLRRVHGTNIDPKWYRACLDAGLRPGEPIHGLKRDQALRDLATAYGYNPSQWSAEKLFTLFTEGPQRMGERFGP